jgi:WD40 repeat protein
MSYDNDWFLSGSLDGTVKLWTLQQTMVRPGPEPLPLT